MRVLYMGTPEFAVEPLRAILDAGHEVAAVVTSPDAARDRGHKKRFTPVKEFAVGRDLEVHQPETLRGGALMPLLEKTSPDVIVVAAYGKIMPEYVLNYPKYGCINIHGSLLPKYRGAAPIQRAVMAGDEVTGVTIMRMDKTIDTGDILIEEQCGIGERDTSGTMFAKLAVLGASMIVKALAMIESGEAVFTKQDDSLATLTKMLSRDEGEIDFNRPAKLVSAMIRGLDPWPCASATLGGVRLKLFDPISLDEGGSGVPGEIVSAGRDGLIVSCADATAVRIGEVQAQNGKRMTSQAYYNGHNKK